MMCVWGVRKNMGAIFVESGLALAILGLRELGSPSYNRWDSSASGFMAVCIVEWEF